MSGFDLLSLYSVTHTVCSLKHLSLSHLAQLTKQLAKPLFTNCIRTCECFQEYGRCMAVGVWWCSWPVMKYERTKCVNIEFELILKTRSTRKGNFKRTIVTNDISVLQFFNNNWKTWIFGDENCACWWRACFWCPRLAWRFRILQRRCSVWHKIGCSSHKLLVGVRTTHVHCTLRICRRYNFSFRITVETLVETSDVLWASLYSDKA